MANVVLNMSNISFSCCKFQQKLLMWNIYPIFSRWILFSLLLANFNSFTSGERHELCNVLIHPGEYIRMRVNAQLNLSCDASSFERDPYEYIPKRLLFWENTDKLENHNYKILNTIITTLLNVDAKVNHTYTCQTTRPLDTYKMKEIIIGDQPAPVKDFSCVSHDFENWKCSFKAYERVPTTYAAAFKIANYIYDCPCVNTSFEDYVCEKELMRKTHRIYEFLLTSKNCFGNRTENFSFPILKNVIPSGLHSELENVTSTTAQLNWTIETNYPDYYTEGFIIDVKYGAEDERTWNQLDSVKTYKMSCEVRLTNLFPFNQYMVEVRVRAAGAKNSPEMSKYAKISFQTTAERPLLPPDTDPGAFFVDSNRCVHIFWRAVPDYKMNGTNFKYRVRIRSMHVVPHEEYIIKTTKYYYKNEICGLGVYEYSLSSENSDGISKEGKPVHVVVPNDDRRAEFPAPYGIKSIYNDHFYKLEWRIPGLTSRYDLANFTILLCSSSVLVSSFEFCADAIEFRHVRANETKLILPYDVRRKLIFAISANYRNGSSGMVMSNCIAHENSTLYRLEPKINLFTDSALTIDWSLKCEERALVTGYILQYCILDVLTNDCIGSVINVTNLPPEWTNYTLSGLEPFTNYSLQIAMLSSVNQGPFSLPLKQQTADGVPSAPISVQVSNITSKSANLSWKVPTSPNGIVKSYMIFIDGRRTIEIPVEQGETCCSYKLDNLKSYQNYSIQVAAVNVWNAMRMVGKLSDEIEFRTSVEAPGAVASPEIKIYKNFGRVSWNPPQDANGPIASIVYELKLCQNTECRFQSTKNTTTKVLFHCSDRERIQIYIRAIQEVLCNDSGNNVVGNSHTDIVYGGSISENCSLQHGRWMLISDINCYVDKFDPWYVCFVAPVILSIFYFFWKIYNRMKRITLVVPQGLHDVLEPSNIEAALLDKPNEEGNFLMPQKLACAVKDIGSETDLGSQMLRANKNALARTNSKGIPTTINKNASVINIEVKVKSDFHGQSIDSMSIQMCPSASKPVKHNLFFANGPSKS